MLKKAGTGSVFAGCRYWRRLWGIDLRCRHWPGDAEERMEKKRTVRRMKSHVSVF